MSKLYRRELYFMQGFDGVPLAFDVGTSSVVYLDDLTSQILRIGPEIDVELIEKSLGLRFSIGEVQEAIEELVKSGLLTIDPLIVEEPEPYSINNVLVGGVSFNVSHRCNMRCSYCFGGGGSYKGPRVDMKKNVTKAGLDYLFANCGNLKHCIISFFGGEPFMNWKVMKWAMNYAYEIASTQGIILTFFITTNGTLLTDEQLEFLNQYDVRLTFSIDGPKEIHDRERRFVVGGGTYEVVRQNIAKALRHPNIICQARPTLTPESCGMVTEIYQHLLGLGLVRMHARPESRYGNRPGLSKQQYDQLGDSLDNLTQEMILAADKGQFWGLINVLKFLNMLYFRVVRHDFCGAGISVISISPDGSIFPCPRYTGEKKFCLGNIFTGIERSQQSIFSNNSVEDRNECKECWARYICGGGCSYMHWSATGDIKKNDVAWCDWTRRSIEIAVKAYAQLQSGEEDRMGEFFARFTPLLSDFGDGADEILANTLKERRRQV